MLATRFAANCRAASSTAKRQLNRALFTPHVTVHDGDIDAWHFDALFNPTQFDTEVT